jgi:hypothetical protein
MKVYQGRRISRVAEVTVDGRTLNPRLDLWNHSPSGLEWGYCGSGPAQLALALLSDCLEDDQTAVAWHQDYKNAVVAGLPYRGWTLSEEQIRQAFASLQVQ